LYDSTALFNTDIYNKKYGKFIHAEESDDSIAGASSSCVIAESQFGMFFCRVPLGPLKIKKHSKNGHNAASKESRSHKLNVSLKAFHKQELFDMDLNLFPSSYSILAKSIFYFGCFH
jgi:hypothetical protein